MDIDIQTNLGNEFSVCITDSSSSVSGNRKLLNRFEIALLTNRMSITSSTGAVESTGYGGNADSLMRTGMVLSNPQAIVAMMSSCCDMTVDSLKMTETNLDNPTERIRSANVTEINVVNSTVEITIQVTPVEVEPWVDMILNLPITRYNYGNS